MKLPRWLIEWAVGPLREAEPPPGRYYFVPKHARVAPLLQNPLPLLHCLKEGISQGEAPTYLALLLQLRSRQLEEAEFWAHWGQVPSAGDARMEPLRQVVECYLQTRDLPGRRGAPMEWPTEDPRRKTFRMTVDSSVRILRERCQSPELIPSAPPTSRGDEPTPAADG